MDMFSLDPKQKINSLSKGMRMKYALALALSHNAELLIMDEPTSGLDPLVRGQLLKILTEYMENGGKYFADAAEYIAPPLAEKVFSFRHISPLTLIRLPICSL